MRRAIRAFDRWLSDLEGVFLFSQDPQGLIRLRWAHVDRDIPLVEGRVPRGTRILELHLWNDHLPPMPEEGPDLAWAAKLGRRFVGSLRRLARELRTNPAYADVPAVRGTTVLLNPADPSGGESLMVRLGFATRPVPRSLWGFGDFWENFYSWWLMWAYNEEALRGRGMLRLRRVDIWISRERLIAMYGREPSAAEAAGLGPGEPAPPSRAKGAAR
ncbi:MAG: hypothetical protein ABSG98_08610 [Anaerolineales bacterium]|jgi:hypothetical protein